jgi:hypothetical protein
MRGGALTAEWLNDALSDGDEANIVFKNSNTYQSCNQESAGGIPLVIWRSFLLDLGLLHYSRSSTI